MQNGDYDFIDRTGLQGEKLRQSYIKTFGCDTFFTSSNAVTENGELYNVDGNSNRVACIVYGPRQVIMIVGVNKIVKDIDEAIYLGERIVVMSARPGEIQEIITTDKYSRMNRGSSGFAAYNKKIYSHFFQDSAEFLEEAEYMI